MNGGDGDFVGGNTTKTPSSGSFEVLDSDLGVTPTEAGKAFTMERSLVIERIVVSG